MTDSPKTALKELANAIDARDGKRADFARAIGITDAYLSQILSGKRPIGRLPFETIQKISDVSGVSLDRLAGVTLAPGGAE